MMARDITIERKSWPIKDRIRGINGVEDLSMAVRTSYDETK